MNTKLPVVVVLGATGSGKSKLGIQIAKRFGGEIISADSMQVYKRLDIITNKVTQEEQMGVPHHIMDFLEPYETFHVVDFRNYALPIIDDLLNNNKLPVIVGGTNYYIEALLFNVLVGSNTSSFHGKMSSFNDFKRKVKDFSLEEPNDKKPRYDETALDCKPSNTIDGDKMDHLKVKIVEDCADKRYSSKDNEKQIDYDQESNEDLHKKLQQIDPVTAKSIHPNNVRKILRALEVFDQCGRPLSEIIKEQIGKNGSSLGGGLRYPNSVILWIQWDQEYFVSNLDTRVDDMIERGLVKELLNFHQEYNTELLRNKEEIDYTKGIYQNIGMKEFHPYFMLKSDERQSETGKKILEECILKLKLVTRRYAKYQLKWIKNRLLRKDRKAPPVYGINGTNIANWESEIMKPSMEIIESVIHGMNPKNYTPIIPYFDAEIGPNREAMKCEVCDKICIGKKQYEIHISSKKHKKMEKRNCEKTTGNNSESFKNGNTSEIEKSELITIQVKKESYVS